MENMKLFQIRLTDRCVRILLMKYGENVVDFRNNLKTHRDVHDNGTKILFALLDLSRTVSGSACYGSG